MVNTKIHLIANQILIFGFLIYLCIVFGIFSFFGQPPYGYHFLFKLILANIVYLIIFYISLIYVNKKIYKDKKITFHKFKIKEPFIQIFLGILIFGNVYSLFDYSYYYEKISYPIILLSTIIITLILLFSLILITNILYKRNLNYAIFDNNLTKKYYLYSKKFLKTINIYKSIDGDNINKLKYTPAFSFVLNKKYNIIVNSEFLNDIDDTEKNVLILHEIGHLSQYKSEYFMKLLISIVLLLSFVSVTIAIIIVKSNLFLEIIALLLIYVFFIFIYLIKSNIFGYLSKFEITADNFALKESNNKKALISLLLDLLSYDLFQIDYNPDGIEQIKIHIDERLKKLDYINTFNNDNDYYENHGFK